MEGTGNPAGGPIRAEYAEGGPSLFWIATRQALLSVVTLGFYRFWMVTRLRRHYWKAVSVMGDPFEYTGTGVEKLLGFLLALVILAVYLTVVNLGLAFIGLSNFDDPVQLQIVAQLSILATLPLIFFAAYRARRYVLSRTRWRGIRFGMDPASWAYTRLAMMLSLLTVLTLGVLYPYQDFRLTKFKMDRTWFGSQRFHQNGRWQDLMGYWAWVIGLALGPIIGLGIGALTGNEALLGLMAFIAAFAYMAIAILFLRYRVASFRYFWKNCTLGDARFHNDIDTGEVIGIWIGGSMAVSMCAGFLALIIGALLMAIWIVISGMGLDGLAALFDDGQRLDDATAWATVAIFVFSYLLAFALAYAFSQIFLVRPILRRKVAGMQIADAHLLARSQQRAHDDAVEAGGFADALGVDIGSGF